MKSVLILEEIGFKFKDARFQRTPWVAKILDECPTYRWQREFLEFERDYEQSNSVGTRGIRRIYILEQGWYYDVLSNRSRKYTDRYFCKVDDQGNVVTVEESEVEEWLRLISE